MNEEFIYFLWKFRLISSDLVTGSGESLIILHPGERNTNSGPDFVNARLRIGGTLWAGNVEIHVRASDWFKHRHQDDPAFNNVILHVVYENDARPILINRFPIPVLELKNQFPSYIHANYRVLMKNQGWIPCNHQIASMADPGFNLWSASLSVDRLLTKGEVIGRILKNCNDDWEEAFYQYLAINLGFKVNAVPFEMLARSLPLKIVRKHVHNFFQLEALLFGQAGMLGKQFSGEYPVKLTLEYDFLRGKYGLAPIDVSAWKFLRLRPSNFPTIRISQWAVVLHRSRGEMFGMLGVPSLQQMRTQWNVCSSPYWDDHYRFGKTSANHPKAMGEESINLLIINGIIPFLFFYGNQKEQRILKERALHFLEQLPPENNHILRGWEAVGITAKDALQTQALMELKRSYCDRKQCLQCRIGRKLLINDNHEK